MNKPSDMSQNSFISFLYKLIHSEVQKKTAKTAVNRHKKYSKSKNTRAQKGPGTS